MNEAALCQRDDSVLVVVDMQTRLLPAMPEAGRESTQRGVTHLLRAAAVLGIPTVITEQYPRGLGATAPELLAVQPPVCERVEKTTFSAHGVERFDQLLSMSGRKQAVLCGIEAHVCVLQTALQLHTAGVQVFVASDAVCSRNAHNRKNALHRLATAGVTLSNVESILFEWLGDSTDPAFREVQALIQ